MTVALARPDPARELVAAFLAGRNARTLRAYSQDLADFRAFVGAEDLDAAAAQLLERGAGAANALGLAYKAHLIERKLAAATVNRRLAALRSLVKLARVLGVVPFQLEVANVKAQAYRDTRGPGLAGVRSMLELARARSDGKGRRDLAILALLTDLGLRRSEVVGLDLEDLDVAGAAIAVLGKGRTAKERLSLTPAAAEAIAAWLEARGSAPGPLFVELSRNGAGGRLSSTGLYRMIRALGARAGLRVRPHGLRHTAITSAVKLAQANGIDLEEVLDFSRHADVRTLLIYRDRERNVQGQLAALVSARWSSLTEKGGRP